jgi:hypothetical protein
VMVLRPIYSLAFQKFLNKLLPEQRVGPGEPRARSAPLRIYNPYFYLWGHLQSTVYATEVSDVQNFQQWTQNGFEMIRATPGIFQQIRQSLLRHATSCVEAQGGHFEHFL